MSSRKYPPLTPTEVIRVLDALGFVHKRTRGSHAQYEGFINGQRRVVTVDEARKEVDYNLLPEIIAQSGVGRDEFYNATKRTAKKI